MTANTSATVSPSLQHQQPILRILLIGLLMVLSGYYIWVLYKAITPNVSIAYKAYYIKNQTLYWQPKQPNLALTLPTTLEITNNIPNLSRAGWNIETNNNMRELTQQGGLYFTLPTAPTANVKITFTLAKALLQLKPITFTFNHHQGTLLPQDQGKALIAQLPKQQFLPSAQQLQSLILNAPTPLQVTSISIVPIDTNTSDTNISTLPHNTGHINQHIGNQK
ncbi:riboflavin synthase subunit alpha [uncultured Photobacterium sp.]|uniref:riboflavin synthase subunit alpha n=1 Tax=uncultured Photobacterium sp. TaxID=173973 RepID=UPI0026144A34|nr:riboflavin synthase subunit alpha [uncultured Photobacterium sp.]